MAGDEVFVGRRDELERFAAALAQLTAGSGRLAGRRRRSPAGRAVRIGSRVILVHGLGGSGKSRLLRQFEAMANGVAAGSLLAHGRVRTAWLDWEDEQRDDPGRYAGLAGPSLVTVLDAVQRAVISGIAGDGRAAERVSQAFGAYRQGAARMPEYVGRFADVLVQAGRSGSPFTSQDAAVLLKAAASAGLTVGGHPASVAGLTADQLAAAGQAGAHLSQAAVRAMTGKRPGEITAPEYELVTDPGRELPARIAAGIRTAATRVPLVVFVDTGEILGEPAWRWLRLVMTRTGPGVLWIIGARFETEAEAGVDSPLAQFVRDIGEHLILMTPTGFDDAMIRAYLGARPGIPPYSSAQIDLIARFTRGLPLAVSLTATLLELDGEPGGGAGIVGRGPPRSPSRPGDAPHTATPGSGDQLAPELPSCPLRLPPVEFVEGNLAVADGGHRLLDLLQGEPSLCACF
jgi:hypothetical protein